MGHYYWVAWIWIHYYIFLDYQKNILLPTSSDEDVGENWLETLYPFGYMFILFMFYEDDDHDNEAAANNKYIIYLYYNCCTRSSQKIVKSDGRLD